VAARGQLLFGIAQKVTKKASPYTPLLPAVLATGGTNRDRRSDSVNCEPANVATQCRKRWDLHDGSGLRPPVAPLLGAG